MKTASVPTPPELISWEALNDAIMKAETEEECAKLLKQELRGRKRKQFALRIHSRLNKLRAARERVEILGQVNEA